MALHLILASFVIFFGQENKSDLIQWTESRKLQWSDFKAAPPKHAGNAALTSSGILISFSTNGKTFSYKLSCNFDQGSSWGRVKNDHILYHEQGHFDIAEIYTRKLNKELTGYRYRPATFNRDINTIYQGLMKELSEAQDQYDFQTDHSRNEKQQQLWLKRISRLLEDLTRFSNYKKSI